MARGAKAKAKASSRQQGRAPPGAKAKAKASSRQQGRAPPGARAKGKAKARAKDKESTKAKIFPLGHSSTRRWKLEEQAAALRFAPRTPWNADAHGRRTHQMRVLQPLCTDHWVWCEADVEHLKVVLHAHLQEDAFRQAFAKRTACPAPPAVNRRIFAELCEELKRASLEELMDLRGHVIDWMCVSDKMQSTIRSRGLRSIRQIAAQFCATNCLTHYKHHLDSKVARHPFTQAERRALEAAVRNAGAFDWDAIAESLQSGRNAWQCFTEYLAHFGPLGGGDEARVVQQRGDFHVPHTRVGCPWAQMPTSLRCQEYAFRYVLS